MNQTPSFHGPNAGYIAELYEKYQSDPGSVAAETRAFFEAGDFTPISVTAPDVLAVPAPPTLPLQSGGLSERDLTKIVAAARLGRLVRELGHLDARLDPLGGTPPSDPGLQLETHGLTTDDMTALPASVIGGVLANGAANALSALTRLRRAYSGYIGYEDDHIQNAEERIWLRDAVETGRFFTNFGPEEKREVLRQLTEVDTFEQYLHKTPPFAGQKRFSIEGCDMMVPMLLTIIRCAAQAGTREVVMGMAHRGRLNVLAHVLGKPYEAILSEFQNPNSTGAKPAVAGSGSLGYSGDVKYHKGYRRAYSLPDGEGGHEEMPMTLAPNPSHLEFVSAPAVGRARAAQENVHHPGAPIRDSKGSLALLIHGDAAFPGQGVVPETLNLGQIPGYTIGGAIHIISNNQLGFTTDPAEARSTLYASDLAKGFEIPIVHVNADEPEACIAVARMACAYRDKFNKDFLIDLVGYRRHGHNEGEEPAFTQPRMYEAIAQHPRVRQLWAETLEKEHVVSRDEAEEMVRAVRERLASAKDAGGPSSSPQNYPDAATDALSAPEPPTGLAAKELAALNEAVNAAPNGFTVSRKVADAFLKKRREAVSLDDPDNPAINWAHAEALAFAAVLSDGTPIRLTGQDVERGTFTQRHLVLHDATTGSRFCALQNLPTARAAFGLHNSPLSETAALGFEYGYSVHATETLVLWEAQFGDFANGAQVIIDQFIVSGNAKWAQSPSVVLLLPHGYEGQGPEHSSARLERFLQLCAGDNLRVANCSTPAQYFHLLRRQANHLEVEPRPLVVMTPKGLLRHPRVASSLRELAEGQFSPVLDDPRSVAEPVRREAVTRLILCSGKVYYDLSLKSPEEQFAPRDEYTASTHVALVRIEELNPFPAAELRTILAAYPRLAEVVWVQEEPQNMGAWGFAWPKISALLGHGVRLSYVGRAEAASPAEGSATRHVAEQSRIVAAAYAPLDDMPGTPAIVPSSGVKPQDTPEPIVQTVGANGALHAVQAQGVPGLNGAGSANGSNGSHSVPEGVTPAMGSTPVTTPEAADTF